ncbi:MAG: hypothetical protein ACYDHW_01055 [Syntrophorhabdaceae bacterium]
MSLYKLTAGAGTSRWLGRSPRLGTDSLVAILRGAFRRGMAGLSYSLVTGRARAARPTCDLAITAAALLMSGAKIVRLTGPILGNASRSWTIVATVGNTLHVRRARGSERFTVRGTLACNFAGRDRAKLTAALLMCGTEIAWIARAIPGNAT